MKLFISLIFSLTSLLLHAQGYVEAGYTPSRKFLDGKENKQGSGSMWQVAGRYTLPLRVKADENRRPTAWSVTISGMYARMDNKGMAATVSPDELLNIGLTVFHLHPLSERWYLMASLGAGLYATPDELSLKSILANGAVIFAYRLRDDLDIGIGAGVTNSYGVPLAMPMGFLKWDTDGRYKIDVEATNGLKASVARTFSDRFKAAFVLCDMDGMTAVVKENGQSKLYSATRLRSYLRPEIKIGKNGLSAYLNVGAELYHTVKVSDRSLKGFLSNFKDSENWEFDRSFFIMAGFKCKF